MNVIKRDLTKEAFDINKIHNVLFWATKDVKDVSVSDIEVNAQLQLKNDITTDEIHNVLIASAVELISENTPNYQVVAANLLNYKLRKDTFKSSDNLPHLYNVITENIDAGVYSPNLLHSNNKTTGYTYEEIDILNGYLKHSRDYLFMYAGLKQFIDKYLIQDRSSGKIFETPQYAYILVAMVGFSSYKSTTRLKYIKKYYNDLSTFVAQIPTPICAGARSISTQFSSCTLIDVGDNLDSIFHSNSAIGIYTANRAGIGTNMGRIRAIGSKIRGGEVRHTGVIPFLKMVESTTRCCTQNGIRGGNSTTHFPFWHREIESILVLKNNKGSDDNRVRKMDYSIQLNGLFFKRFLNKQPITLFSPHEVPDLYEAFFAKDGGKKFEELYVKYEKSSVLSKHTIENYSDLFTQYASERYGTGRMYAMFVDNVNKYGTFIDPIYMSNLCQEILLPTKPISDVKTADGEIALCLIAAINIGAVRAVANLESICDLMVRFLDNIIDIQSYPVAAAEHMKKRRSIGIGITNLAYFLAKNNLNYEDPKAVGLVHEWAEAIQYYLLKASCNLAKERGAAEWFDKTLYSQGYLPIDNVAPAFEKKFNIPLKMDWESLRANIKKYGLRNSVVTAIMPCESSSVITNSTNGIEPPRSLITIKKSKGTPLPVVLPEMKRLKNKYTFAYDMKSNVGYMDICAAFQKFYDQGISAMHYYNVLHFENKEIPISRIFKDVMYAYKMGMKTIYYANTYDGKEDSTENENDEHIEETSNEIEEDDCSSGACKL
jgi:ribonucleoside-diphosphate reductase alpha chain